VLRTSFRAVCSSAAASRRNNSVAFILCSRRNTNIHARMTLRLPTTFLPNTHCGNDLRQYTFDATVLSRRYVISTMIDVVVHDDASRLQAMSSFPCGPRNVGLAVLLNSPCRAVRMLDDMLTKTRSSSTGATSTRLPRI